MNFLVHKSHKLKYKKNWDGELTQNFLIRTRPVTFQWISCSILTNRLDNRPNKVSLVRSVAIHHSELSTHSRLLQIDPSVRRQVGGTRCGLRRGAGPGDGSCHLVTTGVTEPPPTCLCSPSHHTRPARRDTGAAPQTLSLTLTFCIHYRDQMDFVWYKLCHHHIIVYDSFNLFPDPFSGAHSFLVSSWPARAVMWGKEVPSLTSPVLTCSASSLAMMLLLVLGKQALARLWSIFLLFLHFMFLIKSPGQFIANYE